MCFVGLRSGLCVGRSSSFTSNLLIHVFMDLSLSHGGQYCWDRKGPSYNCYCSVDQYKLSEAGNSASNHMLKSSSQNADVLALLHCSDVFPKDIQSLSLLMMYASLKSLYLFIATWFTSFSSSSNFSMQDRNVSL